MNAKGVGAINVNLAAIVTANATGGGTISKNKIYGLTNTTTGAGNYTIGFIPNGANWTFTNNMISITNNNTVQAIGVLDSGAAGTRNYYYNSIYIGGTHAGTQVSNAFQFNAATGTADIKNNIFVMARTSGAKNYAFSNASATFTGITTNYNVLNCSVASTIGISKGTAIPEKLFASPPEAVEERAEQLMKIMREHQAKVEPRPKFRSLQELSAWFEQQMAELQSVPDEKLRKTLMVQLKVRYSDLSSTMLTEMSP